MNWLLKNRKRFLLTVSGLILIMVGFIIWQRMRPLPPLEVSYWYWHSPFRLLPDDSKRLRSIGVKKLYVRAGTFYKEGENIRLRLPQSWESKAEGFEIGLVFNFDYALVRQFNSMKLDTLSSAVLKVLLAENARAQQAGINTAGYQLDFDVPTKQLPRYARLLQQIHAGLADSSFSITALPTWYNSWEMDKVLHEVDFAVPQFYEADVSHSLQAYKTISHISTLKTGLERADGKGMPFYAGLPAYGHTLIYDETGKLAGSYHDMGLREACRYPAFKLSRAYPADKDGNPATAKSYIGEDIYDLVAQVDASHGKGKGYHIVYDQPSPDMVRQHIALLRSLRPRNCLGVILFRYPEPNETSTIPLSAAQNILTDKKTSPELKVELKSVSKPWELIETGHSTSQAPVEIAIRVTNTGSASTFLSPDAVTIQLEFDRPGIEEIILKQFDSVESYFNADKNSESTNLLRSSPSRANMLQFHRMHLAAGETVNMATIRIPADGAVNVKGSWSVRASGGFETIHGEINTMLLTKMK